MKLPLGVNVCPWCPATDWHHCHGVLPAHTQCSQDRLWITPGLFVNFKKVHRNVEKLWLLDVIRFLNNHKTQSYRGASKSIENAQAVKIYPELAVCIISPCLLINNTIQQILFFPPPSRFPPFLVPSSRAQQKCGTFSLGLETGTVSYHTHTHTHSSSWWEALTHLMIGINCWINFTLRAKADVKKPDS